MNANTMKRTFLRSNRYGINLQRQTKQTRGAARSYRTPDGRVLVAQNQAYTTLNPALRSH
jgi:hypothetical protein